MNEIVIHVKTSDETGKGFAETKKTIEKFADDSGDTYTTRFARRMEDLGRKLTTPLMNSGTQMGERLGNATAGEFARTLSSALSEQTSSTTIDTSVITKVTETFVTDINGRLRDSRGRFVKMGETIGESISDGIRVKVKEKIHTSVDVDTDDSLRSKAVRLGKSIGDKISTGLSGALQTFFSGDLISVLVKVLAGGALATALAPVLGAAITSAILLGLGGGVLAAGIVGAFKDPQIAAAGTELKSLIADVFSEFAKPFRLPVAETLEKLSGFVRSLAPDLKQLGEAFAPIAGALGTGLVALLQNATPGILAAAEAAVPLFQTLADHMPGIGDAIGKFFKVISEQGDDANILFGDLLTLVELMIPLIGSLIAGFTSAYDKVHNFVVGSIELFGTLRDAWMTGLDIMKAGFLNLLNVALDIFGKILAGASAGLSWIPGIGPKLKTAQDKFNDFREGVNKELRKIIDRNVQVRVKVFGLATAQAALGVASQLQAMGYAHGGITGAANGATSSGLTLVGERGPELVGLPSGSRVWSAGDSARMMDNMGGGGGFNGTINLVPAAGIGAELVNVLLTLFRVEVDRSGNGSVSTLLNRPGVA